VNGDILGALLSTVLTLLAMSVIYLVVRRLAPNTTAGILMSRSQTEYGYVYGNNIKSYTAFGNFHGIDIRLPVEMPHIYLDSLKAGGHGVNTVIDSSQRIDLEGDFSQYFNVFVPVGYEAVALSIITPDVMEVLKLHASRFDVEIYGSHLRIISNRPVLNDPEQYAAIMQVAEYLLKEIEDRIPSWTQANTLASIDQDLHVYSAGGFRVMGRYITSSRLWLTLWWAMCLVGLFSLGVFCVYSGNSAVGWGCLLTSAVLFAILQLFSHYTEAQARFWSRRG